MNARGQVVQLTVEQLITILVNVAQETHQLGGEVYLLNQWVDAVTPTGLLNRIDAHALFQEAKQAGVVGLDDALHWRWRHSLLTDYLMWEHAHAQ